MALSFAVAAGQLQTFVIGNRRAWLGTITFDSAYPTAGEVIAAGNFGMSSIETVMFQGATALGHRPSYTAATKKIKLWEGGAATEVGNNTDLSTDSVVALVIGT